jgi:hypothetical protein
MKTLATNFQIDEFTVQVLSGGIYRVDWHAVVSSSWIPTLIIYPIGNDDEPLCRIEIREGIPHVMAAWPGFVVANDRLVVFGPYRVPQLDDVEVWTFDQTETYFVRDSATHNVKIGICKLGRERRRLRELQTGNAARLELVATVAGDHEEELHGALANTCVGGEWFAPSEALAGMLARLKSSAEVEA